MKRFATTTLAAATLASAIVVSAVPAFAESIERPWKNTETPAPAKPKGLINSLLPAKPVATKPTAAKTVKTAPSGKKKRKSAVAAAKKSG
ncbi:MAG TPA: hypothetical protein ENJ55_01190, partial [Rhizobiales bacterium]|nr:hypothetical protein [Hyphomicrobiales bacterium]